MIAESPIIEKPDVGLSETPASRGAVAGWGFDGLRLDAGFGETPASFEGVFVRGRDGLRSGKRVYCS